MSIKSVILECDEKDCDAAVDVVDPSCKDVGWVKRFVVLGQNLDIAQDFCPDHASGKFSIRMPSV